MTCEACALPRFRGRRFCAACERAFLLGRREALETALRAALRARGEPRLSGACEGKESWVDEHEDGAYAAGQAIVAVLRKMLRRRPVRARAC